MKRFWTKVEKLDGGCWIWRGAITSRGYGNFVFNGRREQAHRVAWTLRKGPIPTGLEVCHKCDVKNCVRPSHLFLGTHQDNMTDMVKKGKSIACIKPKNGEQNGMSKLTARMVAKIRALYASGVLQDRLAAMYKITQGHVSDIVLRKKWAHVK